jgi:hypothetical protein
MNQDRSRPRRAAPPALQTLISANARYWAAEAEVFTAYFRSPRRTAFTDSVWLARQCYKELVDGVANRLAACTGAEHSFAAVWPITARALADEAVHAELRHYVAFAIAYQISREEAGVPQAALSGRIGDEWSENAELRALREAHIAEHEALGVRAQAFTEGGYCTLYRAGMALEPGCARDEAIAAACARVFDDEWEHMLEGIAGLAETPLSGAQWQALEQITAAQGRCRVRMRNAQFGFPLAPARVRELERGAAAPLAFDYERAGLLPN